MAKKKILYIAHAYHNKGGVEEHLRTLVRHIGSEAECSVVFPEKENLCLMRDGEVTTRYPSVQFDIIAPLKDALIEESFEKILEDTAPDIVHLLHYVYWPISIVQKVAQLNVRTLISFHDFYALTPLFTMSNRDDVANFCTPEYAEATFGKDNSKYLSERRELLKAYIPKFDARILPSQFLMRYMSAIFPAPYTTIPYGIAPFTVNSSKPRKKLRFGYLGALIPQKGWQSLLEGFKLLRSNNKACELHVFGGGAQAQELESEEGAGIFYHGPYAQKDLPRIMKKFDIGVIPSVFPETYSIVLSEMWQAKKPVCVSRIGALHERVIDGISGKKFVPDNPQSIAQALEWFLDSKEWTEFELPTPYTAEEMIEQFWELYR